MKEGRMEEANSINKDSVVAALKEMKANGLDAYETKDPRSQKPQQLLDSWWAQEEARTKGDRAAEIRASVERNLVLIEAGYDDREMLGSVCEWLENDLEDAEKAKEEALAAEIRAKITELEEKLRSSKG